MAITRNQKEIHVSEIKDLISRSKIIVIWDYLGLDAQELSDIRTTIRNANASNKVYKNRIASIAFKESGKEEIVAHLEGPSSFLFIEDENSNALKELHKFIKDNDKISFKAGYIDGKFYDTQLITEIAGLPSKDDLLSMLLSALQGTIRNLAFAVSQVAASMPAEAVEEVKETPSENNDEGIKENKESSENTEQEKEEENSSDVQEKAAEEVA